MEDWPGNFFKMLETFTEEVEQFFNDLADEAIESFAKFTDEVLTQIDMGFVELDRNLEEALEPVYDLLIELEWQAGADFGSSDFGNFDASGDPIENAHPVCVGCQHYHGQSYGGNMLVCGMHPYGWDGDQCPDWESAS